MDKLLSENAIAITPATPTDVEEYTQAPAEQIIIVSEDDSPCHSTTELQEASERDINNADIFYNTSVQIYIRVGQKLPNS
jgi:N-acetyl-beta-hexosaminidase